ncbi:TnsA-like heteromeric transposase endonuclease subunit [Streptomyces sp. H39-S7]|uniref:TnsA-like heteromeric transposase endonuclease subunit n=1 Tax=Streptomyces sp. H39-S7 TaxID=3004357 RepID=UPI0022AFECF4|nr:TnsA-like heteromeric transposase endonuclease subunit [Streptomyces sp. H39-S7]MCZ4120248.1 TnsA-like heteromeric transposase endonuclease subunit [Streptomyces sp. H39-S7]
MVRDLQVVHLDASGRTRKIPAAHAGQTPLTQRQPVWTPGRHPSERSIATLWWSATTHELVGCRSLDRLSVAMLLDFNPAVVDFTAWAAQLEWRERGRVRTLVPDFFVRTATGATVVVHCPPAAGPSKRWHDQREVLQQACQEAGWQLGEPRVPGPMAQSNLRWVSRYRQPRNSDRAVERALWQAVTAPRPLGDIVRACGVPRLLALPRLFHMLWRGDLSMDWSLPLGPGALLQRSDRTAPAATFQPYSLMSAQ